MLMNMKSNSKVGKAITETASIAYTGELLPAGTASYSGIAIDATKRYLKNSGKDKTPALVESGQGKFFNGTNQYINTGIIPNQAEGTLVTRFAYASGTDRLVIGQSGGSSAFMVGVNTSGKLYTRLGTVSALATTWTPVSGKSYHVVVRYKDGVAELIIDQVSIGTFTIDASLPVVPLSLGARNTSTTASLFWNNVIDETYYYDVALTDAQIESLYKYPEKVKEYNGGIVPDIGNEDNCKLFLPMCENSGRNVVNVAVARSIEVISNGGFDTDTGWTKGVGVTISGGTLNFNTASNNIQAYQQTLGSAYGAIKPNTAYLVTYTISAYTSGNVNVIVGGNVSTDNKNALGTYSQIIQTTASVVNIVYVTSTYAGTGFVGSIDNISVKEITAYPLVNYTTAMHTSAAKLSYGAQCTAWKRDSLGVLLGMSNGLSFDGGVSTKGVSTGITLPNTSTWAIEIIIYVNGISSAGYLKALYGGSGNFLQIQRTNATTNQIDISCMTKVFSATLSTGWHHIAVDAIGKFYVDGILVSTQTPVLTGVPTELTIGSDSGFNSPWRTIVGTPKIHKGAEYAKFNIAKAWANAQKTIAKLGA